MSGVQTVEISWGKECMCGAVDWVFMNPHAITFTTSERLSPLPKITQPLRTHTRMWARVRMHMRPPTNSHTCMHVYTHFNLNCSTKFCL